MKKYFCLVILMAILGFIFYNGNNVFAFDGQDGMYKSEKINGTMINESKFRNGMTKREIIKCYNYDYGDKSSTNFYKYAVARIDVSYIDSNGVVIASAYFESTFRYNEELGRAKCLSTSHGQSQNSDRYTIEIMARTKNLAINVGQSFGKIVLLDTTADSNVCRYIFSCDSKGNISKISVQY